MNKFIKLRDISEGKALNIIQKPILTEKSTNLNNSINIHSKLILNLIH